MIRKLLLPLAMFAALSACPGPIEGPSTPSDRPTFANRTTADEQARLRCEKSYKLSRSLGELAVDAGLIKGANAVKAAALDRKLFAALGVCRSAYNAFNSSGLLSAADNLDKLADDVDALVKGASR